jgi:hypothetical protein
MSTKIAQFTAHPIDHDKASAIAETIAKDAELNSYLERLLEWAYKEHDGRQFYFAETTTEVRAALQKIIAGEPLTHHANVIANRLLKKEKDALKGVEHLKGVHEGMLLQAAFANESVNGVLLAKVDLSEFLRRENFRSDRGIDMKHRLLKFCVIECSDKAEIIAVHVGDTNSTIAAYWWKDFLELTEKRTDSSNTKTAFAMFDNFLAKSLRKDYPRDYPVLFNEVLRRFKRNQSFKFSKFLDDVFDGYRPVHANLNLTELKRRAKDMLDKNKFDANFTILPSEVEKRFKKTYTLTPQIELTVDGEVMPGQISALALEDGTKGVFVKSDTGYEQFPLREAIHAQKNLLKTGKKTSASVNLQSN